MVSAYIIGLGFVFPQGVTISSYAKQIFTPEALRRKTSVTKLNGSTVTFEYMPILRESLATQLEEFDSRKMDRSTEFLTCAMNAALGKLGAVANDLETTSIRTGIGNSIASSLVQFEKSIIDFGPRRCDIGIFPNTVMCAPSSKVAIVNKVRGENTTISSGKCSGLDALGLSFFEIVSTGSSLAIAGATDALSTDVLLSYAEEKIVRDFEKTSLSNAADKDTFIIPSEGACVFMLSSAKSLKSKNTHPLAAIVAYRSNYSPGKHGDIPGRSADIYSLIDTMVDWEIFDKESVDYILTCTNKDSWEGQAINDSINRFFDSSGSGNVILSIENKTGEAYALAGGHLTIFALGLFDGTITRHDIKELIVDKSIAERQHCSQDVKRVLLLCLDVAGHNSAIIIDNI
ncbi:MAG: 3-oxoacyl-(acyl-carrier-protein) synthase [Candidatus Omnitrophota bacterium]|jgi:3-oxoacyl-(acyl-carrier-protein) synthase